jgi:hypothetical protein
MLDMSGSVPFSDGPYSGELVSTLHARFGPTKVSRSEDSSGHGRSRRPTRLVTGTVRYRIEHLAGRATATFAGLPAPGCLPLDACSSAGFASLGVDLRSRVLRAEIWAVPPRSARSPRRALVSALRHGRAQIDAYADFETRTGLATGPTQAELSRDGADPCRDTGRAEVPLLTFTAHGPRLRLTLGGPHDGGSAQAFDSRCPGPVAGDVLGDGALARGATDLVSLARRSLRVQLTRNAPFAAGGYAGSLSSRFTLVARRRSFRASFVEAR